MKPMQQLLRKNRRKRQLLVAASEPILLPTRDVRRVCSFGIYESRARNLVSRFRMRLSLTPRRRAPEAIRPRRACAPNRKWRPLTNDRCAVRNFRRRRNYSRRAYYGQSIDFCTDYQQASFPYAPRGPVPPSFY